MSLVRRILVARELAGSAPVAVLLLIGANLIPLAGVLFFGWDLMTILVAYWLENGIVGLFNVLRLALAAGGQQSGPGSGSLASSAKVALIPFFVMHYGIFWLVHGAFVFVLPGLAGESEELGPAFGYVALATLALALSHGASFVTNYIGRGEYRRASVDALFLAPYGRVVVLHLTVLLGGFLILESGGPAAVVALLVVLKTAIDLLFHLREHRRRQPRGTPPAAHSPAATQFP